MNNSSIEIAKRHTAESIDVKSMLLANEGAMQTIAQVADLCVEAYQHGRKVLWAGNGGSAADAQHMAGEMVSKFQFDRPALSSIALTTDTSIITAISNDMDYSDIFARQLQAHALAGDVFVGISTSGNSKNLVKALPVCRELGVISVALVGASPCKMDDYDIVIKIPSTSTPRIQECQTLIGHIICSIVEERIFGEKYNKKE
ncbi:MAG: SIS domain-containing protein [Prevotella sp.]|nr:SIS domain-containing protein [Prevotella sp.]